MTTPIESIAGLVIGAVESVSPDEIRILLELDAPQATALNTGTPAAFPRLNGYVLIPNEAGATVAYISWIGIERSPYPKRSGLKDFGLIDLPFPLRKMCVSPEAMQSELATMRNAQTFANDRLTEALATSDSETAAILRDIRGLLAGEGASTPAARDEPPQ